ncbi:uncharacterized protein [Arachis hypogaea]|uniref:uncharacterized protein n=1 Tax=Arachis hypogaea TaxID=3818 RepID=UPI000DED1B11|nr:uncharacterized protein LOC112709554 [Arachis hypogaea]
MYPWLLVGDDLEDDDDLIEIESEEDEKESNSYDNQVTKWFDGLIDKDIQITNEVYSVQGVEFDRQELRKLVRRVHSTQEMKAADDEEEKKKEMASTRAKKALTDSFVVLQGVLLMIIEYYLRD